MPFTIAAHVLWGLFPLYFPLLAPASAAEVLAHRIVWTCAVMALILLVLGRWRRLFTIPARQWLIVAAAGALISVNWGVYVLAVTGGRTTEAALGYFLNPLVSVALGVVILGETLRPVQRFSVGIAAAAGLLLTIEAGSPPWISLFLAFSFAGYSLMKKRVLLDPLTSLAAETLLLTPVFGGYLLWLGSRGQSTFLGDGAAHTALLLSAGVVTAVPLLLFGAGAQRVPLSTMGMIQYLTPIIQMALAVTVLGESMPLARWGGFAIIWVAVALFAADAFRAARKSRSQRAVSSRG